MGGENINTQNMETIGSQAPGENKTTYENLGEQVEFDPVKAKHLREEISPAQEGESERPVGRHTAEYLNKRSNEPLETPTNDDGEDLASTETRNENLERQEESQPEKRQTAEIVTTREFVENPKKSRAERAERKMEKLNSIEEQLSNIEKELSAAKDRKEQIAEEIESCQSQINNNAEEQDRILDRINRLGQEIKNTKESLLRNFATGTILVKNLILGKHEEIDKILEEVRKNNDANKKAMQERETSEADLKNNQEEGYKLRTQHSDLKSKQLETSRNIARLEKQKTELSKKHELIKEEVAHEKERLDWEGGKATVKREMGDRSVSEFKRELDRRREETNRRLEQDLADIDDVRNGRVPGVYSLVFTDEMLQHAADRADEAEERLRDEYQNHIENIDFYRDVVDKYFPTWQARVENIRKNHLVKEALSTLKRRALMRIYGM